MRVLKLLSSYYQNNDLGYTIIAAILNEMLSSQHSNRSWVLCICCRIDDASVAEYQTRALWSDDKFTDSTSSAKDSECLRMNYYKLVPSDVKNSNALKLTEFNLEVILNVERRNEPDKMVTDYINKCYRDIQKTVATVIEKDAYHIYGNSNLPAE